MTRRRPRPRAIDWDERRARLASLAAGAVDVSPEQSRAIMARRAHALARKTADASPPGETIDVLVFALGGERYAIETAFVHEVVRLGHCTPVPGAPDVVAGVTNHRGQILCVMDLRAILRAPGGVPTDPARMVVLGAGAPEFGVLADLTEGIVALHRTEILPAPAAAGGGTGCVRAVTPDALVMLDGTRLLDDPRLRVDAPEAGTRWV